MDSCAFYEKLKNLRTCPICLQSFKDPVLLPCLHTFCRNCVQDLLATSPNTTEGKKLSCPACRRGYLMPENGHNQLESHQVMHQIMQFEKAEKVAAEGNVTKIQPLEKVINLSNYCEVHTEQPLDVYCYDCSKLFCVCCIIDSHPHHKVVSTRVASRVFSKEIQEDITRLTDGDCLGLLTKTVLREMEVIVDKANDLEMEITRTSADVEHQKLQQELSTLKQNRVQELQNEKKELENHSKVQSRFLKGLHETLENCSPYELCRLGVDVHRQTDELVQWSMNRKIPRTTFTLKESNLFGGITEVRGAPGVVEKSILICGLYGNKLCSRDVLKLEPIQPSHISSLDPMPTDILPESAAVSYRNSILIVGVGAERNEIWKLNMAAEWTHCGMLISGRRRHCVAVMYDTVFIFGGRGRVSKSTTDDIEQYNPQTEQSFSAGKLCVATESATAVAYKGTVFLFGGVKVNGHHTKCVQLYNPHNHRCTISHTPMPNPCGVLHSVLWETSVVLINYSFCFIFNLNRSTWTHKHHLRAGVLHFGLVTDNKELFIIGGGDVEEGNGQSSWKYSDEIKSVPMIDIFQDEQASWHTCGRLPRPGGISSCASMHILSASE